MTDRMHTFCRDEYWRLSYIFLAFCSVNCKCCLYRLLGFSSPIVAQCDDPGIFGWVVNVHIEIAIVAQVVIFTREFTFFDWPFPDVASVLSWNHYCSEGIKYKKNLREHIIFDIANLILKCLESLHSLITSLSAAFPQGAGRSDIIPYCARAVVATATPSITKRLGSVETLWFIGASFRSLLATMTKAVSSLPTMFKHCFLTNRQLTLAI